MAIFHCSTSHIRRGAGHSAVAAAAYRSASCLADERTGEVADYTRKAGVLSAEIVMPYGLPAPDRAALFNAAEAAEQRKDARTAREWRIALPDELNSDQRRALAHEFAQTLAERYGVASDVCLHAPDRGGDQRNWHGHILCTVR